MNNLSKKERQKIYMEAAKFFSKSYAERIHGVFCMYGFCDYLNNILKGESGESEDYPEYAQFKTLFVPEDCKMYWFDIENQTTRVEALTIAAKLCTMSDKKISEFFRHMDEEYQFIENLSLAFTKWKLSNKK